jgi:PAS domain S-box-containing protein
MNDTTAGGTGNGHFQDQQLLHYLVNSIEDYAIYLLDQTGLVLTWNLGAQKTKGFSSEEIIGKSFESFFTPEAIANGVPASHLKVALSEGRTAGEEWRVRKNGER